MLGSISTHTFNQTLFKQPQYNVLTDFTPVALIAETPLVLVTRKDLPPKNLKEFAAHAKERGDKLTYGTAGVGSANHLSCILLDMAIGTTTTHVPYRSGGQAMQDLVGGQIDFDCNVVSSALPQINGKLVNTIAMLSRERVSVLPDVPTAHEQGFTNFDASTWNAIFLPPKTPPAIVKRLSAAILEAMRTPAVQSARGRDRRIAGRRRPPLARLPRQIRARRNREVGQDHPRRRHRRIDVSGYGHRLLM